MTKIHRQWCVASLTRPSTADDKRIAITGGNQCLDLGPSGPQTYQCTPGIEGCETWPCSEADCTSSECRQHQSGELRRFFLNAVFTGADACTQIWTAGGSTTPPPPPPPPPSGGFRNVYNCNNNGQVAMTFDDGPATFEGQIANEMQGGKATFFLNGNNYRCIYDVVDQV